MEETFLRPRVRQREEEFGEMRLKKIGKRGSAIIALAVVLAALVGSPAASASFGGWGPSGDMQPAPAPTASWGEAS